MFGIHRPLQCYTDSLFGLSSSLVQYSAKFQTFSIESVKRQAYYRFQLLAARLLNVLFSQISNFQNPSLELQALPSGDMSNHLHPASIGSNASDSEGIVIWSGNFSDTIVRVGTEAWLYPVRSSMHHSNQSLELNMAEHENRHRGPTGTHKP